MKRKATRFLALAMSAVLVTSLTACGDGSDENAKDAVTPVEAQTADGIRPNKAETSEPA